MIDLSQEIRVLNTTAELIENSVNRLLCSFYPNESNVVIEVKPKDIIEKRYFFILLLEIISPVNSEMIRGKKKNDNLLTILSRICENPILSDVKDNTKLLSSSCQDFIDWLWHDILYTIYSSKLDKDVNLMISRNDILYLVGNRSKHTLVRSNRIIKKLAKKYAESGVETENGADTLILEDIDNIADTIMEFAGKKEVYVSIDIDVVDPAFAPATGYLEPGGLTSREFIYLIQRINKIKNLRAVDIVEINPEKDKDNLTVKLGAKVLAELL